MTDNEAHSIIYINTFRRLIGITFVTIFTVTGITLTLNSLEPTDPPHYSDSIEVLLTKLNTSDDSQRVKVLFEIAARGPAAKEALPALTRLLSDRNLFIRKRAIEVMRSMPKELGPVVPDLIKALSDKDSWVRNEAASTLKTIGPPTANLAIPALIKALKDEDDIVQNEAAWALAAIGPAAKDAIPILVEVMDHLPAAVAVLGAIGPAANSALPAIAIAFKNADLENKAAFPVIFAKIGPASIPVLVEILKGEDLKTQRFAAYALHDLGPSAKKASPVLVEILIKTNAIKKGDREETFEINGLHEAACSALWRIDPKKAEAISEKLNCEETVAD